MVSVTGLIYSKAGARLGRLQEKVHCATLRWRHLAGLFELRPNLCPALEVEEPITL